jgi:hypothetical protein
LLLVPSVLGVQEDFRAYIDRLRGKSEIEAAPEAAE